jgi:RNA polymerase sigma factor (sigma-70 family)
MTDYNIDIDQTKQLITAKIPYIKAIIFGRVPPQDVDDVSQEALHRMLCKAETVKSHDAIKGWMFAVTINVIHNYWRQQLRNQTETLPQFADDLSSYRDERSPDLVVIDSEDQHKMATAIDNLPDNWRSAVMLFYIQELSLNETATELDRPPGTVKRWLFMARKRLRRVFK